MENNLTSLRSVPVYCDTILLTSYEEIWDMSSVDSDTILLTSYEEIWDMSSVDSDH